MNQQSILPIFAIAFPLIGAVSIRWIDKTFVGQASRFTAFITLASAISVAAMYPHINAGKILVYTLSTGLPLGIFFRVDTLGFFVGIISICIWMLVSFYSVGFMKDANSPVRYNAFSLLTLVGMLGVVFSGDLFSLYIFFELLSVASFMLMAHKQTRVALKGAIIYIFMGISGGLILLFSIILTYSMAGTINFSIIGFGLKGSPFLPIIFTGYIIGFGVKAGIFPLHFWMPSAYPEAPTCAVALSSGVMIKAGAYGIIRTVYGIMGSGLMKGSLLTTALLFIALISIFVGSAAAINQTEIKRLLGYSSVSQIGYIILGVTLLSPTGLQGGLVHIFNHAIIKAALFMCAGAMIQQTGRRYLKEFKGIGHKMPVVTFCFTFAALSMIGLPPFNGFISKWFLAIGALEAVKIGSYSQWIGILAVGILILSSFMNLVYYGPVVYGAWFEREKADSGSSETQGSLDPGTDMLIPILILAMATLAFGLMPGWPLNIARKISEAMF
ncbi:monovalent cation/H+ antiporter subunit D family protein [bacterium]|nr:monovalent cation/H+ antiporter subunit D family protein [bacterium]